MNPNQVTYFGVALSLLSSLSGLGLAEEATASETVELVFPIVAAGVVDDPSMLQTQFIFMNLSNSTAQATLVGYQDDGTATRVRGNCESCLPGEPLEDTEITIPIAGNGGMEWNTLPRLEFIGWASLTFDASRDIWASSNVFFRSFPNNCVCLSGSRNEMSAETTTLPEEWYLNAVAVPAVKPAREFRGKREHVLDDEMAIAVVNPSPTETASVEMKFVGHEGQVGHVSSLELAPLNRIAGYVRDLVPTGCCSFVHVTSDIPIAVAGITVLDGGGRWINLPFASVAEEVEP